MAHTEPSVSDAVVLGLNSANGGAQIQDADPSSENPSPAISLESGAKVRNDGLKSIKFASLIVGLIVTRSKSASLRTNTPFLFR